MQILISDWSHFEQVLPLAKQYQVGLEIDEFTTPENLDRGSELAASITERVKGLPRVSVHGPFYELIPASCDPLIRQVARQRFQRASELAQMIGAQHLILHSGYFPKTYPAEQWLNNSIDFWVDFLDNQPFEGLIHLENVYEDGFTGLKQLVAQVNQIINARQLTICLDIGHVHANSSHTLGAWIQGLGDHIRYVHVHNNNGILDDHWQLDTGKIDMRQTLNLLKEHCPQATWTVETLVDQIEPSLQWLQQQGYM
jgi:sugar phosphate isomerase/epimerase